MKFTPEIESVTVVFTGAFNASIFTPAWFEHNDLISESQDDQIELKVVLPHISEISSSWFNLVVTNDRFQIESTRPPYIRVCDLVLKIFDNLLPHTPLTAFGINKTVHFCYSAKEHRNILGRSLAPIQVWGKWGEQLGNESHTGGMTSLKMTQVNINGRPSSDEINVIVEPSSRVGDGIFGVYVHVNDHHTVDSEESTNGNHQLLQVLKNVFETSIRHSDSIIEHLMQIPDIERSK